jgi:ubiquinone/menaquinone biosynthesis C-methylase UbiE
MPPLTLAQRLFQHPWFVAAYDQARESRAAWLTCGMTFRAEAAGYASALASAPGRSFLEVACGQGSFGLGVLAALPGARFTALDLSPAQLARAGRKATARGLAGRYERARGDALRLPFAAGTFDGVLCVGGLHQIPDPALAVAEVGRVLRPRGVFTGACFALGSTWTRPFGMNAITRAALEGWLRAGGFEDVSTRMTAPIWCVFRAVRRG